MQLTSGKHPCLKGRDVYDLIWYLGDPTWPPPNIELLNNALHQTGWDASIGPQNLMLIYQLGGAGGLESILMNCVAFCGEICSNGFIPHKSYETERTLPLLCLSMH